MGLDTPVSFAVSWDKTAWRYGCTRAGTSTAPTRVSGTYVKFSGRSCSAVSSLSTFAGDMQGWPFGHHAAALMNSKEGGCEMTIHPFFDEACMLKDGSDFG